MVEKRLYISQPMRGLTDGEIENKRNDIIKKWRERHESEDWILVESRLKNYAFSPLASLGESLKLLATADTIFMSKGWSKYRGCCVEHICALYYGIKVDYEDPSELLFQRLEYISFAK